MRSLSPRYELFGRADNHVDTSPLEELQLCYILIAAIRDS